MQTLPKDIKTLIVIFFITINLASFIAFAIDKKRSKRKQWRIPESSLISLSFLGGSLAGIIAMYLFNHKTKKKKFTLLLPIFLFFHVYIILISIF